MKKNKAENGPRLRLNMVLTGEPAEWLEEWKRRGIIKSFADGVKQALREFNVKLTEQDLKHFQLRRLKDIDEEEQ